MKVGIIGCGNMGEAVIARSTLHARLTKSARLAPRSTLIVSEKNIKKRNYIRRKYRVSVINDNIKLVKNSDVVILAIKPQDMPEVLDEIVCRLSSVVCRLLFISIAAGISTHFIESFFKTKVRVIRVMPNMAALIGEGISAICKGRYASGKDLNETKKIFRVLGEMIEIEEKYLNLITGLSGSGPAYFFYFVEQLIKAGVSLGLEKEIAEKLVIQTGLGSLKMLAQGGDAKELREKVTSKGGTTEAAFRVFQKRKIDKTFAEAVKAAVKKAEELSARVGRTKARR